MRKLIESSFVSLDGVVAPEKMVPLWSDENRAHAQAELAEYDAFLMGRVTYEMFKAMWGPVKGSPYIDLVNQMPKYVASTTLRETTWNATLLKGDVPSEVRKLKAQPGKHLIKYGSGKLDRTLLEHKLIDELRLTIFPIVIGAGPRLFEGLDTSALKLKQTDSKTFANGTVRVVYSVT